MPNYTLHDLSGIAVALPAFGAILFCPGFLLAAAAARVLRRPHGFAERIAWSIALSFATAPILTVTLGRLVPFSWAANFFWLLALAAVLVLLFERQPLHLPRDRATRMLALTLPVAALLIIAELVDIQLRGKLFLSVTIVDQSYRTAFTNAILNTGIPPANPLYFPFHAAPLRYYYGWYALCAACARMASVSARQALIASSVWVLLGLASVFALFGRHFLHVRNPRRFTLIATLLLAVTGLDLLPVIGSHFAGNPFLGDMEWWSVDQISSWLDSILWVPNHTAALVACAVCFLLLWHTRKPGIPGPHLLAAVAVAAAAAASAFAMSIYVAFGFALILLAFALWRTFTHIPNAGPRTRFAVILCATAVLALLPLLPILHDLLAAVSATNKRAGAGPAHLFSFSIRAIIDPTLLSSLPAFTSLDSHHPILLDQFLRLALLPLGLVLEFGLYALILYLAFRRRKQLDEPRRAALFLVFTGIAVISVLRSSVSGNNDFGYRAALLPSFFLLVFAADFFNRAPWHARTSPGLRRLIASLLVLGLAGTTFQAFALRLFVPWQDAHHNPDFTGLSTLLLPVRQAYSQMPQLQPQDLIQSNPAVPDYLFLANMVVSPRPMVTDAKPDCGSVFGGNPQVCPALLATVRGLFATPALPATQVIQTCRQLGISYLLATPRDPAWQDPAGWMWTLPLVTSAQSPVPDANPNSSAVRILKCSGP